MHLYTVYMIWFCIAIFLMNSKRCTKY